MKRRPYGILALCLALAIAAFAGCNLFDPLDKVSGDQQTLSAARAAFDRGDYAEAATLYGQLSSDYKEVAASETAFRILAENGVTMGDFMTAFGRGGAMGKGFTKLAGAISKSNPGETKRLALLTAFQMVNQIPTNRELRGVVRLVTAAAILSEVMAEDVPGTGIYTETNLASNVSACRAANVGTCATAACDATSSIAGSASFSNLPPTGTTNMTGTPNWAMVNAAFVEINYALTDRGDSTNEIPLSASFGGDFKNIATAIITAGAAFTNTPNCYRWALLGQGFGSN